MKYTTTQLAKALCSAVDENQSDVDMVIKRFVTMFVEQGGGVAIDAMLRAVGRQWEHQTRNRRVTITTARDMEGIEKVLKKELADMIVETNIDKSLIGGAVIQVGDTLIDGSIKKKLEKLHGALIGGI